MPVPATEDPGAGLRDHVLAGLHTSSDFAFATFERFLREDKGALALWFGERERARLNTVGCPSRNTASHRNVYRRQAVRALIERDIVSLDAMLATQIDIIIHHARYRRLEGSWRGLLWLVQERTPGDSVLVRVLSLGLRELERDLSCALEFDQSTFFKLVYEGEFGHAGGQPFGLLVVDHEVAHQPVPRFALDEPSVDDIDILRQLAAIAASAFVPVIIAASPRLFDVDSFSTLTMTRDITAVLKDNDHRRWRSLTQLPDARFLCITLPRLRARPAWNRLNNRGQHQEYVADENAVCWHSAGYAFARNVVRAQKTYRWPADIKGVTPGRVGGGLVTDTVRDDFRFGHSTRLSRAPLELGFTDVQAQDLAEAGFLLLNTLPFGDCAFASSRSVQKNPQGAKGRGDPLTPEKANQHISADIASLLCVCRFAH